MFYRLRAPFFSVFSTQDIRLPAELAPAKPTQQPPERPLGGKVCTGDVCLVVLVELQWEPRCADLAGCVSGRLAALFSEAFAGVGEVVAGHDVLCIKDTRAWSSRAR